MGFLDTMLGRFVGAGRLTVIDHKGRTRTYAGAPGPAVTIRLHDAKVGLGLVFNPELTAGEAYMDERLTVEAGTLRDFLTLYALNRDRLRALPVQKALRRVLKRLKRWTRPNLRGRAKANVEAHYDLSNEMYALFLDEGLNYSCGYFPAPDMTLEEGQIAKLRHIAAKLDLKPGQRVLDIGCGWGSMALYLAEHCGVEVVGVTLSSEQCGLARQRAEAQGLAGRVRFELMDYRDIAGPFDRIVSVGMFEHVGVKSYPEFFAKVSALLKPDGFALLHSIGRMGGPGLTGAWVRKYIFPGGYSPALSEALAAVEGAKLWVTDIEVWRLHYAQTLVHWERRFQANRARAAALLGERFCRMWEFYLITAEFSFRHGKHAVFQIQLAKTVDAVPLARDYMAAGEAALALSERRGVARMAG